ncbi:helix-turn-helix transcriptional regulator [Clostridium thailandense]|uniref:helix-turn-helix transcriptional regulator n=1 Tax=Clostridium thailandense TaxID=2794346 RepID=UPI00398A4245
MRKNLKNARIKKEVTVAEIATLANISSSFYYKIESGLRNPTMNLAKKISDILGKDINYLFFNDALDEMSKN